MSVGVADGDSDLPKVIPQVLESENPGCLPQRLFNSQAKFYVFRDSPLAGNTHRTWAKCGLRSRNLFLRGAARSQGSQT